MNLCLITSNIRFDNPSDGSNSWNHRKEFLTKTLLSHDPDIIASQEGRFNQLKEFEDLLVNYEMIDYHRSWIKDRMYPTFFLKKNKFEIIKSLDIWLSETPDIAGSLSFGSAFPRLMTWIKVQPKNSDLNFLLVNTHLDHVKEETRLQQTRVLVSEIEKIQTSNSRLIILGDFNDPPEGKVRKIILKSFPDLIDGWKLHNASEETSHHAFNGECQNGSRIDWILTDQSIQVKNCIFDKRNKDGKFPSDHFPVICKIKV